MAGRDLRRALAVETLADLALAAWLHGEGWSWGEALGLCVALFLGLRALVVVVSYTFWLFDSSPVPPELRLGLGAGLRMVAQEYVALLWLFVIVQPFERRWMAPDRLRRGGARPPLLLVHGYQCNRGFWVWLRPRLEAAGWTVATHSLEPVVADIDSYAPGLEQRITEVLAATGAPQVILVGHSMGGLASRAYVRAYGAARVARLITLGSPHYGSRLAWLAWGRNGVQMHIGHPWLRELAGAALPPQTTSIYSVHDNQVMPQRACSELAGAKNLAIGGVSHLGMAFSPPVLQVLLEELQAGLPSPPAEPR